jgi:hypothetical protein
VEQEGRNYCEYQEVARISSSLLKRQRVVSTIGKSREPQAKHAPVSFAYCAKNGEVVRARACRISRRKAKRNIILQMPLLASYFFLDLKFWTCGSGKMQGDGKHAEAPLNDSDEDAACDIIDHLSKTLTMNAF